SGSGTGSSTVKIDQTTPGTTNGVGVKDTAGNSITSTANALDINIKSGTATVQGTAITPVVSSSGESSHVLKAGAGTLFTVYAINLTSTPGYLVVLNATSAGSDGAITPLDCAVLPASGSASITYSPFQGHTYSTGITAVVTSATTCFTKT